VTSVAWKENESLRRPWALPCFFTKVRHSQNSKYCNHSRCSERISRWYGCSTVIRYGRSTDNVWLKYETVRK